MAWELSFRAERGAEVVEFEVERGEGVEGLGRDEDDREDDREDDFLVEDVRAEDCWVEVCPRDGWGGVEEDAFIICSFPTKAAEKLFFLPGRLSGAPK